MEIQTTKKRFSVDEYYRMADAGIIAPQDRVELIDGEIIQMSPIGSRHSGCVNRLIHVFTAAFHEKAVVSPQHPLRLNPFTEPEPDLTLLKFRPDFYSAKTPEAGDALLVVEVSDSSLRYDRDVKLPRYAAAGIREVWIASLEDDLLLVHRELSDGEYRTRLTLGRGDSVQVSAFPGAIFEVRDLLG